MLLGPNNLSFLSKCAISAGFQAGHIIREHPQSKLQIRQKNGGESVASQVVTTVDNLAQEAILEALEPTCSTFDLAILAEESADNKARLKKEYFWSIDPLDGTLSFINNEPGYSVSIALVSKDGIAQIGVVYDPLKQTLYHSIKDIGAFKNGKQWTLSNKNSQFLQEQNSVPQQIADSDEISTGNSQFRKMPTSLLNLNVISDLSFKDDILYTQIIDLLNVKSVEAGYKGLNIIFYGGAVLNACKVLEEKPACYFKFPRKVNSGGSLWDYAATSCIFNELGAVATDIYGQPLDLNRADSTFMNHKGILYASNNQIANMVRSVYQQLK